MQLHIAFNPRQLADLQHELRDLPGRIRDKALVRGINRTGVTGRARAVRKLKELTGLKQKDVRSAIAIRKANRTKLSGAVIIKPRRLPLTAFGARQTKRGVTYKLPGGNGRKLIVSGFMATMPSGHLGAFKRRTKKRLPIDELRGQALSDVFANAPGVVLAETNALADVLLKNVTHEVEFILSKRGV